MFHLPEPILAEASAYATSFEPDFTLEKSLSKFVNGVGCQIISQCAGDLGEYSAVMTLTYAMDQIRRESMLSSYNCDLFSFSSEVPVMKHWNC